MYVCVHELWPNGNFGQKQRSILTAFIYNCRKSEKVVYKSTMHIYTVIQLASIQWILYHLIIGERFQPGTFKINMHTVTYL